MDAVRNRLARRACDLGDPDGDLDCTRRPIEKIEEALLLGGCAWARSNSIPWSGGRLRGVACRRGVRRKSYGDDVNAGTAPSAAALAFKLAIRASNINTRGANHTCDDCASLENADIPDIAVRDQLLSLATETLAKGFQW
jgi:hypothetical protein